MKPGEYGKAIAFREYVKVRKLIQFNLNYPVRGMRGYRKVFVPRLQKRCEDLEKEYPDFPAVFRDQYPDVD